MHSITAVSTLAGRDFAHADAARVGAPARSFEAALSRAKRNLSEDSSDRPKIEHEAREAAKSLVASAFLVPLLASIRETSLAAGPFAPTTAERRFGPLIDQQIADQVMRGTNFALVDAIVDRVVKGPTRE